NRAAVRIRALIGALIRTSKGRLARVIHRAGQGVARLSRCSQAAAMGDELLECQRDLLRLQQGVISRRQALAAGPTVKAMGVRLGSGGWQRLQPGVYTTFSGEPPRTAGRASLGAESSDGG